MLKLPFQSAMSWLLKCVVWAKVIILFDIPKESIKCTNVTVIHRWWIILVNAVCVWVSIYYLGGLESEHLHLVFHFEVSCIWTMSLTMLQGCTLNQTVENLSQINSEWHSTIFSRFSQVLQESSLVPRLLPMLLFGMGRSLGTRLRRVDQWSLLTSLPGFPTVPSRYKRPQNEILNHLCMTAEGTYR